MQQFYNPTLPFLNALALHSWAAGHSSTPHQKRSSPLSWSTLGSHSSVFFSGVKPDDMAKEANQKAENRTSLVFNGSFEPRHLHKRSMEH